MDLEAIQTCRKCPLSLIRRHVVVGRGPMPAELAIIGEGPGNSEDVTGEAFAGTAGRTLDRMLLDACHVDDSDMVQPSTFMTNSVLCHPSDTVAGDNRKPTAAEVHSCMMNVLSILEEVKPLVVILAGETAQRFYMKEIPDAITMYHPSYIDRTGGIGSPFYQRTIRILYTAYHLVESRR